jgi:hypothetical protein
LIVPTTMRVESLTMLTVSEMWLTTHTSSLVRARTETGSSPTATSNRRLRCGPVVSNTSSRASAVLTARSFVPSGVMSSGWTCGVSQFTNEDWAFADAPSATTTAKERSRGNMGGQERAS